MWGPGAWMAPMWGFWWVFPVIGLLIFLFFVVCIVRMIAGGGDFMCMGPRPRHHDSEQTTRLRREVEELREQVKKQGVQHEQSDEAIFVSRKANH